LQTKDILISDINISSLSFDFGDKLSSHSDLWDQLDAENSYWSADYFNTLNENPPSGVKSHACLVTHEGKPVAKFLFQYLTVRLSESFGDPSGEQKKPSFLQSLLKRLILPFLNFKIIVNGNLLLSGSYGFKFADYLDYDIKRQIFHKAIEAYRKFLKSNSLKASGILLKDLDNPNGQLDEYLKEHKYTNFKVQPKMKFEVPQDWQSMEDYKAALKSKYRVRFNKAKKSLGEIYCKRLSIAEIKAHSDAMYRLYLKTVGKAGFNLFLLDKQYFLELAKKLEGRFIICGLFQGSTMVSFFTLMDNGTELDAHYLGYDPSLNHKHKLYQNILYFMVEIAIDESKKTLHMSRTALEIKSSVGTIPEEVQLFAKYYNRVGNWLLPKILDITVPEPEWQARSPFK